MTCLAPQQEGRRCADVALSHPRLRFPALVELGLTLLSEVERGRQPREGGERRKGRTELNEDDMESSNNDFKIRGLSNLTPSSILAVGPLQLDD